MKKIIVFCLISISAILPVEGQIYTPSGAIQGASINDNVGIGTNQSGAKLTIKAGPDGYPTPLKAISIWGPNSPANSNSAQDLSWDFAAAGSASIRSYRGGSWDTYLQFLTNSNIGGNDPQVRMHIGFDGNVGIGTLNPDQKLTVNGGIGFGASSTSDKKLYAPEDGVLEWMTHNWAGAHGFAVSHQGIKAVFFNTSGDSYLNGGNLGIGTTSPDEKLTVKGKIHTQEVKVDLLGALVPDYVFASDYKLKPLQEVETYIKANNHLPEIPSAKEFEKNGLMLAEMNMNLLKKVEELTLYAIEQEKKIKKQSEENTILSKRLSQIENKLNPQKIKY